jgi:hypothetical protein
MFSPKKQIKVFFLPWLEYLCKSIWKFVEPVPMFIESISKSLVDLNVLLELFEFFVIISITIFSKYKKSINFTIQHF